MGGRPMQRAAYMEPLRQPFSGMLNNQNNQRYAVQQHVGQQESEWARALGKVFPMDERAFDFLLQQPVEVQETVIMEFRPRRDGDPDYSGAITSFVKNVANRMRSDGGSSIQHIGQNNVPLPLVEAFRRRYPVDDRAWDFLVQSAPATQRHVIETFKPKQEGEQDYSGLIT